MVTLPADLSAFESAAEAFRRVLDAQDITGKPRFDLELIFEEIVTNTIRYGYRDRPPGTVTVSLNRDGTHAVAVFDDDGAPFNPLAGPDRTLPSSIDEATPGGLGLILVRKAASSIDYARTADGHNVLTVAVALGPPPSA